MIRVIVTSIIVLNFLHFIFFNEVFGFSGIAALVSVTLGVYETYGTFFSLKRIFRVVKAD